MSCNYGPMWSFLKDLGQVSNDISVYHKGTRDNKALKVYKCNETGVIFLDRVDQIVPEYANRPDPATAAQSTDNQRRYNSLKVHVTDNVWVDVGAGSGGLVYTLKDIASEVTAVEPDRRFQHRIPVKTVDSISRLQDDYYNVATLMHVLEHMEDPVGELIELRSKMKKRGMLFVEVPHARDWLIENCFLFRSFTFWSQHLILHTRKSLHAMLHAAGFRSIWIESVQRYPLANHLYWLIHGMPDGHVEWETFTGVELDAAYSKKLGSLDKRDTLYAIAFK